MLSTTDTSKDYAPTFVGNGYLAARVPAAGEGYSNSPSSRSPNWPVSTRAPAGQYERRASLPTWTTLGFGRSRGVYGVPGNWSCRFDQLCPATHGQISGGAFVETSHGGSIAGGYLAGLNTDNSPDGRRRPTRSRSRTRRPARRPPRALRERQRQRRRPSTSR